MRTSLTADPSQWTIADVGTWLVSIEKSSLVAAFKANEVNGADLKEMDEGTLDAIGVKLPAQRRSLLNSIKQLFAPGSAKCQHASH